METLNTYLDMAAKQNDDPRNNVVLARYRFNKRCQEDNETVDDYVTCLSVLAEFCKFGELKSGLIRDRLICDVKDPKIVVRLLHDAELTLQRAVNVCLEESKDAQNLCRLSDDNVRTVTTVNVNLEESRETQNLCWLSDDNAFNVCPEDDVSGLSLSRLSDDIAMESECMMLTDSIPDDTEVRIQAPHSEPEEKMKSAEQEHSRKKLSKHHDGKKGLYGCDKCDQAFTEETKVESHMTAHSDNDSCCKTCTMRFVTLAALKRHALQVHDEKLSTHQCVRCGKMFYRAHHLKDHMVTHSNEMPHQCDVCGRAFKTVPQLRDHAIIHSNAYSVVCQICGKAFKRRGYLKTHMSFAHTTIGRYTCDVCGVSLKCAASLKNHKMGHDPNRPPPMFPCAVCNKKFKYKRYLKIHERVHLADTDRPYQCGVCCKGFISASVLAAHQNVHKTYKSHVCQLCRMAYKWSAGLKKHNCKFGDTAGENIQTSEMVMKLPKGNVIDEETLMVLNEEADNDEVEESGYVVYLTEAEQLGS